MLTGGCACGRVRYRLTAAPYDTAWCRCRLRQHISGSGGMVFTTVKFAHYRLTLGDDRTGRFASTDFGTRTCCLDSGSPLTIHVARQPLEIDIAAGSLDDPGAVQPAFHLYAASAPAGARPVDRLPRYDALRPTTRGLRAGQTEA